MKRANGKPNLPSVWIRSLQSDRLPKLIGWGLTRAKAKAVGRVANIGSIFQADLLELPVDNDTIIVHNI